MTQADDWGTIGAALTGEGVHGQLTDCIDETVTPVRCHGCNADLPAGVPVERRRVVTGGSKGASFGRWRYGFSERQSYSERPFCTGCIARQDAEAARLSSIRSVRALALFGALMVPCAIIAVIPRAEHTETGPAGTVGAPQSLPAPSTQTAHAEKRCAVRVAHDPGSRRIANVHHGASVTLLEQDRAWSRIKTTEGVEGWIENDCLKR